MIKSITLQNYRSFGAKQTIPLEPITVLVGPNNSGKSSFMSVGSLFRGIHEASRGGVAGLFLRDLDLSNLLHRPPAADGSFLIEWETDQGSYGARLRRDATGLQHVDEWLRHSKLGAAWATVQAPRDGRLVPMLGSTVSRDTWQPSPFAGFYTTLGIREREVTPFAEVLTPLARSREVKLSLGALRTDAPFENQPVLGPDGSRMATVVSLWRSAHPERAEMLDATLQGSIPEIRHVLATPAPTGPMYRLWFRQKDGEMFDAFHVSDGVLLFTALAMQAIDAGPGSVIFLEEPEHSIHPTRLHDIVELLRRMVHEKGCQFVIATHSPVLLSEFRDEPEAILLFRRGDEGTLVTRLSDVPRLVDALRKADPGEMLSSGFFNDPI
jgi:predicted ATPase